MNAEATETGRTDAMSRGGTLVNILISRVVYVLALSAIAISLATGLAYYAIIYSQTVSLMKGLAAAVIPPVTYALADSSPMRQELILAGVLENPLISEILISSAPDREGEVLRYALDERGRLVQLGETGSGESPVRGRGRYSVREELMVREPGGRILAAGDLILVMDRDYLLNRTGTAVIFAFVASVLTVALFGMINSRILRRTVARPMSRLHEQLNALDVRRLKGYSVDLGERDNEFALIEDSVNLLVRRIQAQIGRLEEAQDYIARIIDNAPALIVGIDANYRIRLFNAAAEQLTGRSAGEVRYRSWLGLFFLPDERDPVRRQIDDVFANRAGGLEAEGSHGSLTSVRSISWRAVKVLDPDGFHQLIAFGIEITEQKQARMEIIALNEHLEDRVAERTEELRNAVRELEDAKKRADAAGRGKADFLSAMSHEIRTPLNAILGMAEMLSTTELDRDQRRFVTLFQLAGQELMQLINDILDYSRMDEGRIILEKAYFPFREQIANLAALHAYRSQEKGVQLIYRVDGAVPLEILGDQLRISQIVNNLLSNAVKFTAEGVIHLTSEFTPLDEAGSRECESDRCGELLISVEDSGIGIPEDKREAIFHHFTQGDAGTSRVYGGSGLGLSITRGLVELMDGSIELESAVGTGSTFAVRLPIRGREAPEQPPLPGFPGDLLVIACDRDPLVRRLYADAFPDAELILCSAGDELEAALATSGVSGRSVLVFAEDGVAWEAPGKGISPRIYLVRNFGYSSPGERRGPAPIAGEISKPFSPRELREMAAGTGRPAKHQGGAQIPLVPDLSAYRMLLVEDSRNNQLVVGSFLEATGIRLDIASSGAEGVQRFAGGGYHLVLMDINMPGMDGYEATRAIRRLEADEAREPVTILALTADAMDSTVRASLEAGCDGHFTKPISRTRLIEVVARALPGDRSEVGKETERMEPIIIEVDPIIRPYADQYIIDTLKLMDEIRALHKAGGIEEIRERAHRVKGEGGTYGFDEVSRIGKLMQEACEGDGADIPALADAISEYLGRVKVV
jgi:PAS domain S-box-containing protein